MSGDEVTQLTKRLHEIRDQIVALPLPERLRLAAEMLERGGVAKTMVLAIVETVHAELAHEGGR